MNSNKSLTELSKLLKFSIYPKQHSRFCFAILSIAIILVVVLGFLLSDDNFSLELIITIILVLTFIIFFLWLMYRILYVILKANTVEATHNNFPEIVKVVNEIKDLLSYTGKIKIFISQDSNSRSLIKRFLKSRYLILSSGLEESYIKKSNSEELRFLVVSHIGGLKSSAYDPSLFIEIIEELEDFKLLNFFILPYARSRKFTGDNIGLLINGNLVSSLNALCGDLIGNTLSPKVNISGIIDQKLFIRNSFIAFLSRLFLREPYIISRYINIVSFCKIVYPNQYMAFLDKLSLDKKEQFNNIALSYKKIPDFHFASIQSGTKFEKQNNQTIESFEENQQVISSINSTLDGNHNSNFAVWKYVNGLGLAFILILFGFFLYYDKPSETNEEFDDYEDSTEEQVDLNPIEISKISFAKMDQDGYTDSVETYNFAYNEITYISPVLTFTSNLNSEKKIRVFFRIYPQYSDTFITLTSDDWNGSIAKEYTYYSDIYVLGDNNYTQKAYLTGIMSDWEVGIYRVDIYINEMKLNSQEFHIY